MKDLLERKIILTDEMIHYDSFGIAARLARKDAVTDIMSFIEQRDLGIGTYLFKVSTEREQVGGKWRTVVTASTSPIEQVKSLLGVR